MGISDEHLNKIKEIFNKKNEKFKVYLLNLIKSLVKKCFLLLKIIYKFFVIKLIM